MIFSEMPCFCLELGHSDTISPRVLNNYTPSESPLILLHFNKLQRHLDEFKIYLIYNPSEPTIL